MTIVCLKRLHLLVSKRLSFLCYINDDEYSITSYFMRENLIIDVDHLSNKSYVGNI